MTTKTCIICKIDKPLDQFHKCKKNKSGYRAQCKSCRHIEAKKYYSVNKEKSLEYSKKYRQLNRICYNEYHRKWASSPEQRKKACERVKKRYHKKLKYNLNYRINKIFSDNIRDSLYSKKEGHGWTKLVNYTLIDLKQHLEKQFKEGMNWNNYGKWHIDHIIPKSYFMFTHYSEQAFKDCWALTNLQPLWAKDNYTKGNRYIG